MLTPLILSMERPTPVRVQSLIQEPIVRRETSVWPTPVQSTCLVIMLEVPFFVIIVQVSSQDISTVFAVLLPAVF